MQFNKLVCNELDWLWLTKVDLIKSQSERARLD